MFDAAAGADHFAVDRDATGAIGAVGADRGPVATDATSETARDRAVTAGSTLGLLGRSRCGQHEHQRDSEERRLLHRDSLVVGGGPLTTRHHHAP